MRDRRQGFFASLLLSSRDYRQSQPAHWRSWCRCLDRYTRRHENFVLVRSNRAITVAARNRRLALMTNILSRDSHGAVPVAARGIKGGALASLDGVRPQLGVGFRRANPTPSAQGET